MTFKDAYPILPMGQCLDSLGKEHIFSTLDANYEYWQIKLDDCDKEKVTLKSHHGLYRCLRMPFSPKNTSSTSQRVMENLLLMGKRKFALVDLDDVVIFSRSVAEHLDRLRTVLGLLPRAKVSLSLKMCFFVEECIDYLGHIVQPGTLGISTKVTDAIGGLQHTTNVTELKSLFLGLRTVFRRLVQNFIRIAALLSGNLKRASHSTLDH